MLGQSSVDVAEPGDLEILLRLFGRADERQPAPFRQDHDQVAGRLDVGQAVRDADDRLAAVGHLAEQLHDLAVGLLVEAGRHLVEEQQARAGHELVGQARPLDLTAAQVADERLPPLGQTDDAEDVRDARLDFPARQVRRQPQFGRVPEGRSDRQGVVQHVLLGHDGDVFLEGLEVRVEVFAVDRHAAGVGRVPAAEDRQQGRLARTARAEQADELPGPDHEADVVEQSQRLAGRPVLDDPLQPACGQLDVVRPRPAHEPGPVELERKGADVDPVAWASEGSAGRAAGR